MARLDASSSRTIANLASLAEHSTSLVNHESLGVVMTYGIAFKEHIELGCFLFKLIFSFIEVSY